MSGVRYAFARWPDPYQDLIVDSAPAGVVQKMRRNHEKLIASVVAAESERRWEDALLALGRNRGPLALDRWWPTLTMEERRAIILDVWEGAEWPVQILGERRWLAMFKDVGFVTDDGRPQPDGPIEIWRGASVASKGRGMSWTNDRQQAKRFATLRAAHFDTPTIVYTAVVPPRAVLAFTGFTDGSRGEHEVIVNPNMLRGRISAADPAQAGAGASVGRQSDPGHDEAPAR